MSCFKQKLPSIRYKLLSSLLQPLTTAGFSFPGDKGCVCTATRAVYQMLTANCLPSTAITAGPNSSFFKKKKSEKEEKESFSSRRFCFSRFMFFHENCCAKEQTHKTMDSKAVNKVPSFQGCPWVSGKFSQKSISLMWIFLFILAPQHTMII